MYGNNKVPTEQARYPQTIQNSIMYIFFTVNIVLNCLVCYTAEWIFEQLETKLHDNKEK